VTHPAAPIRPDAPHPTASLADPFGASQQFAVTRDRMIDALASEHRLIEELIGLMRRQRAAVGADDLQAVEESVYAMQRVLCTLGEARKRRRALNARVGCAEDLGLHEFESAIGASATPRLREARETLQSAAQTLSTEVAINRRVLREALAASDQYVRALLGGAAPEPLYTETAPGDRPAGARLLDRQA
jgi:hypothetical protein